MMSRAEFNSVCGLLPWPEHIDDELLTSFLSRAANQVGARSYHFCSYYLRGFPVWERDFDRFASDEALRSIAALFTADRDLFLGMTLRTFELSGAVSGVGTWINAAGTRYRNQRLHGLQYCPECLREAPGFRRQWRLACMVGCERHLRLLRDCCPNCGEPVIPHLAHVSIVRCHRCGVWLTGIWAAREEKNADLPFEIQSLLVDALSNRPISIFGVQATGLELARWSALLIQIARKRARTVRYGVPDLKALPSARVELLRVEDRVKVLRLLESALTHDPEGLENFCRTTGMVRQDFESVGPLPAWLSPTVSRLSAGTGRRQRHRSRVAQQLAHIRARRAPGWRGLQAQLLVDAAAVQNGH